MEVDVVARGEEKVEGGRIGVDEGPVSTIWCLIFASLLRVIRALCFSCRSFLPPQVLQVDNDPGEVVGGPHHP